QSLGQTEPLSVHVGTARARLGSSAGALAVLDPALNGHFPFYSTNYRTFRVRVWSVEPKVWPKYMQFTREHRENRSRYNGKPTTTRPPGKKVMDKQIEAAFKPDALIQNSIDLRTEFSPGGFGHLIVWITPVSQDEG